MAAQSARNRVIPGFGLSMGITLSMLSLLILLPLLSVLGYSLQLSPKEFFDIITVRTTMNAFKTSIGCAAVAAFINLIFGTLLAWVLCRYRFPGRKLLDGLIELPFALPTAVAGITLTKMYADTGEIGSILAHFGIHIAYTHAGIVVALVFVGIPFVVRSVQPVLEDIDVSLEEAAHMLGASHARIFFSVVMPELLPAMLAGFGLALARGIGEYGSVIYISGNSAREGTQVVSYLIMQKLNSGGADYSSAASIALCLLIISFVLLLLIGTVQAWAAKRTGGAYAPQSNAHRSVTQVSPAAKRTMVGIAVAFALLMLVAPLFSVLIKSLGEGFVFYLQAITTKYALAALRVTLLACVVTVIVNTFFGLFASWLLTRFTFPGKKVLSTLIDIPFSISPVIAGLAFIMTFGRMGWARPALDFFNSLTGADISVVFSIPGVILATIFVTFPFVSRELIPVMNSQGSEEEEAAALMGAKGWRIFREVTFPKIKWALFYGVTLCAARAIGEFGAVSALSKTRGQTFTLPLEVDALYNSGSADSLTAAFAVSSILVLVAIGMLLVRNLTERLAGKQDSAQD